MFVISVSHYVNYYLTMRVYDRYRTLPVFEYGICPKK